MYFASSGNAAAQLGLSPYLVRQGLAYRLNDGLPDPEQAEALAELPPSAFINVTGVFLDVARTRALANEVFMHRSGLPDEWPRWPWRAVMGIPSYYSWVHYSLYEAALLEENLEEAEAQLGRAEAWARLRGEG